MTKEAVYVGVDVAKNSLDVAVSNSEEVRQFTNDHEDITNAVQYIAGLLKACERKKFGIEFIDSLDRFEEITFGAIIITVAHGTFKKLKLSDLARMQNTNPILVDVRGVYNGVEAKQAGFTYKTL